MTLIINGITTTIMLGDFAVLPGFYQVLFLHFEPLLTMAGAIMAWFLPGTEWYHSQLVPASSTGTLDPPTTVAMGQLGSCMEAVSNPSGYALNIALLPFEGFLLIGLTSSFSFRAIKNTLPNNFEAQERILGVNLAALAICDISHILVTWIGLPKELRFAFGLWNPMTHGNITFTVFLFLMRLAWFAGIGRQRFYYGKTARESRKLA